MQALRIINFDSREISLHFKVKQNKVYLFFDMKIKIHSLLIRLTNI